MKNDLNLLPKEIVGKKGVSNKTLTPVFLIIGVVVMGYLIGYPMYQKVMLEKTIVKFKQQQQEYMKGSEQSIRTKIERYAVINSEIERDKKLEAIVNKSEMGFKEVLNAIEISIPARVSIENISMNSNSESISISAVGTDEYALTDFWSNLRATKVFDNVIPKAITEITIDDADGNKIQVKKSDIELIYVQKG